MEDLTNRIKDLQSAIEIKASRENIDYKKARIQQIIDSTRDRMIQPGFYTVTETDHGGMYDEERFSFELATKKNLKEIALQLMEEKGYMSPWNDLRIEEYKPSVSLLLK